MEIPQRSNIIISHIHFIKTVEVSPKAVETEDDVKARKEFLRKIGYKL